MQFPYESSPVWGQIWFLFGVFLHFPVVKKEKYLDAVKVSETWYKTAPVYV